MALVSLKYTPDLHWESNMSAIVSYLYIVRTRTCRAILSRIGKSDFNDLKCWMRATRHCVDFLSRSGSVSRAGSTKELASIGCCFDLRGLRRGRERTGFVTTVGSRTIGFGSFSFQIFTMGFISIGILGFGLLSDLTRFTTHFGIDPDLDSGFLCAF